MVDQIGALHMTMVSLGERRHHPPQRLGRLATIKLGVGIEPRYVLVTNVSAEGVRLQLNGIEPFDEFVLLFHGSGAARDGTYRVAWRQGQEIGAKFTSDATQNPSGKFGVMTRRLQQAA
jgi:hypothetical protein